MSCVHRLLEVVPPPELRGEEEVLLLGALNPDERLLEGVLLIAGLLLRSGELLR